jgi:hypothetical protein
MHRLILAAFIALALPAPATAQSTSRGAPAGDAQYKVGDRLPQKAAAAQARDAARYREVRWDEQVSPDWNPAAVIKALNLETMLDSDPRAIAAMEKLREAWNNPPANATLNGAEIRLADFVVPLEHEGSALREFLLVPCFGACIHVPPPPANQVVHAVAAKPVAGTMSMDAV